MCRVQSQNFAEHETIYGFCVLIMYIHTADSTCRKEDESPDCGLLYEASIQRVSVTGFFHGGIIKDSTT